MDGDGAAAERVVDVPVAVGQLLDVAVEIQPDDLGVAVDDGAAGAAADGVGRVNEVEGRRQIDLRAALLPARRQIVGRLLAETFGAVVEAVEGRLEGDERGVFAVAERAPVGEAQGEGGVGRDVLAVDGVAAAAILCQQSCPRSARSARSTREARGRSAPRGGRARRADRLTRDGPRAALEERLARGRVGEFVPETTGRAARPQSGSRARR